LKIPKHTYTILFEITVTVPTMEKVNIL